ncbi:MAG: hypothetical protein MPN21_05490 [Thermoanaerobaculia bacterium]|nr:hypothetical protein [Thermoanaerobaculia bacterium]
MKQWIILTTALALAALWGTQAAGAELAVGSDGQVLRLIQGQYGDLFPDGEDIDRTASVLAVEIVGAEGVSRTLVPSTADLAEEFSPTLYHDPIVDVTYVLWSSRYNGVHPFLRLTQYSDGEWSETLDITGSVFAAKNDPRLSVHHDSWSDSEDERIERTVFHVIWWEDGISRIEKRVAALILENGTLVGSTGLITLSNLISSEEDAPEPSGLGAAVRLVDTENGLVVGFVGSSGRLEILRSAVLPEALSQLGVAVEQAILAFDPNQGLPLEEVVIESIAQAGTDFHPATLQAMADSVFDLIEDASPDSGQWVADTLSSLSDKAMPHIIEIGARMKAGGLEGQDVSVITVRPEHEGARAPAHHLAFSNVASFDLPDSVPEEGAQLFISERGTAALIAWDDGDYVAYRETTSDGWSDVAALDVTKGIDRATAYRILEERTLER